jgi:CRISPR-associated protein Cas2
MSLYVACYDISNPRRRRRVASILAEYGRRLQASVFEIDVDPPDMDDLRMRIGEHLGKHDLFDFLPIDRRMPARRISWQRDPSLPDNVIVV